MISVAAAGNLGKDSELKFTANGDGILSFSVACRTGYDKQAQKEKTTWLNCSLFGKRAETLSEMLKKGTKCTVFGSMEEQQWTDNEGNKHSRWQCNVNEVVLQGGKPQQGNDDGNWSR